MNVLSLAEAEILRKLIEAEDSGNPVAASHCLTWTTTPPWESLWEKRLITPLDSAGRPVDGIAQDGCCIATIWGRLARQEYEIENENEEETEVERAA